jgi:hydroxymethylglutaryl-CoA lyase
MNPEFSGNRHPKSVKLIEVGPRDGFQFEEKVVPTRLKVDVIAGLVAAGLREIQATSFVHPGRVPQMADAERLIRQLPRNDGVRYSGLVLNQVGLERARAAGLEWVEVSVSASETHSRKNAGVSAIEAAASGREMVRRARSFGIGVRAGVQCAFGCAYEGHVPGTRVLELAEAYLVAGADLLALSDTTGMATPVSIREMLADLLPLAGNVPVVLHLHDTRGLGLANVSAALECGVSRFDTALGGMGGCPFVPGAAGNIATEDTAYLLASMGIETGIDIAAVAACTERLEAFFRKRFPAKKRNGPEQKASAH